jgi:hypothetical protein
LKEKTTPITKEPEIIDRIGKFVEAGVDEIMFCNIPTGDVEAFQRVEEEIVAAF